jgi:hypothetical protein
MARQWSAQVLVRDASRCLANLAAALSRVWIYGIAQSLEGIDYWSIASARVWLVEVIS